MSEANITVMGALELALDVAFHDGTPRDLAVAAEAWAMAGYYDGSIDIWHSGGPTVEQDRLRAARAHRHQKLLKADARGMLAAFRLMADAEIIDYGSCSEARRLRWVARGGNALLLDQAEAIE